MSTLNYILQPVGSIDGYGKEIIGWNLSIIIEDPSIFQPDSMLLVQVYLKIRNPVQTIHIAQQLPVSSIQTGTKALLPLTGTLWILGRPSEITIEDSQIEIYYRQKESI